MTRHLHDLTKIARFLRTLSHRPGLRDDTTLFRDYAHQLDEAALRMKTLHAATPPHVILTYEDHKEMERAWLHEQNELSGEIELGA